MRKAILIPFVLVLLAAGPRRPEIITISPGDTMELKAGSTAEYSLKLSILKGYHIQANPASEEYLIPTVVKIEPVDEITPQAPVYPKGIAFKLQGSEKEIQTYENDIVIHVPVIASSSATPGEKSLKGMLRYQGCDATTCFPPKTIPFDVKVSVR